MDLTRLQVSHAFAMTRSEQRNEAAKNPSRGGPELPVSGGGGATRLANWLWWLLVGASLAVAMGAWMVWRYHAQVSRLQARLPAMPDVSARPAALDAALREAGRKTLTAKLAHNGVVELARLYHANGYNQEAEACWRILGAEQPQEARWSYYLADLRRTTSDDAGMVSLLEQTVKLAPDYAPAWLKLAEWEFKTGRLETAERDYRRRLALRPADPYARLGLARVALQRDHREEGKQMIEEIVRDVPIFSPAHNLYAEMLAADGDAGGAKKQRFLSRIAGRFREAEDPWLEELQAWCYDPSRLAVWASIDDMTNHGDRGVALLERAIKLAPDDARDYTELGRVYLHLGNAAKALAAFEQGLRLRDAPSDLFAGLSEAHRALNQPEKALEAADRGLALMPDAADLETARGIALEAAGRLDEAVAAYRLVVKQKPNVCEMNYDLGNALLRLGRSEEAYEYLNRALELEPTFPRALIVLGESELEAGRLEEAARYVRPLYDYYPGSVSAQRLMTRWCLQSGVAAARAGRMAEAEGNLRDGLAISPNLPELHGRLGLLYAQQRRFTEALDQLEAYHRLKPAEPMASLFLGQVYANLGRIDDARRVLAEGEQLARQAGDSATAAHCTDVLNQLSK
jgi:HemY protein